MARVSILMPIHNCEKTLKRTLDSIYDQTYQDFELIAVFNNCTDTSEKIVRNYRAKDLNSLTVLHCSEKGIVPTLNTGIPHCNGELIARMDGDDKWYSTKLEKQIKFLDDNPDVDIVGTQLRLVGPDGLPLQSAFLVHPTNNNAIKEKLLSGENSIVHPSVVFRKHIFLRAGTYDDHYPFAEDYHLWLKCCKWYRFANLPETLLDYTVWRNEEYNPAVVPLIQNMMRYLYGHIGMPVDGEGK